MSAFPYDRMNVPRGDWTLTVTPISLLLAISWATAWLMTATSAGGSGLAVATCAVTAHTNTASAPIADERIFQPFPRGERFQAEC
jgi:hypothetical protein